MRARRLGVLAYLAASVATWALCGCQPADYRRDADRTADELIRAQQQATLGRAEPFTIETPADTLRRRLLLGQNLQTAGAASLGAADLKPIAHWPEEGYPSVGPGITPPVAPWAGPEPLKITMIDALMIAARNSRDYQSSKERIFQSALSLDLQVHQFESTFAGALDSLFTENRGGSDTVRGVTGGADFSWDKRLKQGASIGAQLGLDLVKLLTMDRDSAFGIFADATVTVPLLRGAVRHVVTESLTQAERNLAYNILTFEQFKQTLAVRVANEYLSLLGQLDQVKNAEDNYKSLISSVRRARRLADAGRLPDIQVGQARQDELRARDRWISAQQSYKRQLDSFKLTLGLPVDALIDPDREDLVRLVETKGKALEEATAPMTSPASRPETRPETLPGKLAATRPTTMTIAEEPIELVPPVEGVGPFELPAEQAVRIALSNRQDLKIALGQVFDAQRGVVVAADALKAGLTFTATGSAGESRGLGSASSGDAAFRPADGVYTARLLLDLPLDRTAERNQYRLSYVALEQAVRQAQQIEDQVKLNVRDDLRTLLQTRESYQIQLQAVALAERRVASTELFLQAGRAEIRDVLDAQESLVSAQNARTSALVSYRVAELELQRDMGVLTVDEKGLWHEYQSEHPE